MASLSWAREAVEVRSAARPSMVRGRSEACLATSERPLATAGVRLGV